MLEHMVDGDAELDWLGELNDRQREAATAPADRPLLILAGAGSGKTATLSARVAWLIAQGLAPERILLLTFTRRAAREMLTRTRARRHRRPRPGRRWHLPLGRLAARAPVRRAARPAAATERARRQRQRRSARPRPPGARLRRVGQALPAQ